MFIIMVFEDTVIICCALIVFWAQGADREGETKHPLKCLYVTHAI